jgi:hypothetical protein
MEMRRYKIIVKMYLNGNNLREAAVGSTKYTLLYVQYKCIPYRGYILYFLILFSLGHTLAWERLSGNSSGSFPK